MEQQIYQYGLVRFRKIVSCVVKRPKIFYLPLQQDSAEKIAPFCKGDELSSARFKGGMETADHGD